MAGDRCTGHCCKCFTIPYSPEELEALYWRWQKGGEAIETRGQEPMSVIQDIHLIAPMLTYVGSFSRPPKGAADQINQTDSQLLNRGSFDEPIHYYSCKHFDPKRRICTIYPMRPQMCMAYPYGRPCNYAGCTWKAKKARKETPAETRARRKALRAEAKKKNDAGGG